MRKIFLTGATGVMGMATLREITSGKEFPEQLSLTVLARPGKTNEKKLAPYIEKGVNVIWGDLLKEADVAKGVEEADLVMHVGGMVSPAADHYPEKTIKVNVGSMRNIVNAALKKQKRGEEIAVIYIGSVSQYGDRRPPFHWGRAGDPIVPAVFDTYAYSKCLAELVLAESELNKWASLRQTGILHPGILMNASDPISFHVPMKGVLEWVTVDDSGRLMASIAKSEIPDKFWKKFYNIGGGQSYRKSNYEFVGMTLAALGCPPTEKSFRLPWFATRNFHGVWYTDSNLLEEMFHYLSGETMQEYMDNLKKQLPFYFRLAPLAPAFLIRNVMKIVAKNKELGTLGWVETGNKGRLEAHYGGLEAFKSLTDWSEFDTTRPSDTQTNLDHGYDESKPESEFDIKDMRKAAQFRGGECLSESMKRGDLDSPLEWRCSEGHEFKMTPRSVLKGGHWCGECLKDISRIPSGRARLAQKSPFLSQIQD